MDKKRIIAYTVAVVIEFALAHNMTAQEAFRYLERHKGHRVRGASLRD